MIKTFYSIVIFLTILITFLIYDVVVMLGENRCWSLKVEAGVALWFYDLRGAYVNRDTTTVVSQIKWSHSFLKKSVKIIYRFSQG